MASSSTATSFLLFLLPLLSHAAIFNIFNNCTYTVWAAAIPGGGQQLDSGQSWTVNAPSNTTSGRITCSVPMDFAPTSACKDLRCTNSSCPDAYQNSTDDTKTYSCPSGTDYRVTFCPQNNYTSFVGGKHKSNKKVAVILGPVLGAVLLGIVLFLSCWILKRRSATRVKLDGPGPLGQPLNMDFPFVDLAIIQAATGDFSNANKLGEGGFGPVYKGTLSGGREIAVKRLSTKSKQGASEFKNEVKLIAKLQHRNLVRVLGCCVEREEQLLIYEYLPNKSLDAYIFDESKRSQLDWTRRHLIIGGIARGLLYLHEDSLLKVIHRDLKASNVLLDNTMNPKISDFGMAKIFETDVPDVDTGRVVGTFGYMAPEYAMDGIFSEKSDVYSFGVLLLEIVSGQKNGRSHFEQYGQTLPRRAWRLWSVGRAMELIDVLLGDTYLQAEAKKVIHIGLLCVQEKVEERPIMSSVVLMLRSDQMVLPEPTQPPTFFRQRTVELDLNSTKGHSINEVTITEPTPR